MVAVAVTIIVIIVTDEPRVRLFADGASGYQNHLQGRMCDSEAGHAAQVTAADVHTQLSQIPTPHKPPSNHSGALSTIPTNTRPSSLLAEGPLTLADSASC